MSLFWPCRFPFRLEDVYFCWNKSELCCWFFVDMLSALKVVLPSAVLLFPLKCQFWFAFGFCSILGKPPSDSPRQMCQGGGWACTEVVISLVSVQGFLPQSSSLRGRPTTKTDKFARTRAPTKTNQEETHLHLLAATFRRLMLSLQLD